MSTSTDSTDVVPGGHVEAILASLSSVEREVLLLHLVAGQTHEQAAASLAVPVTAIHEIILRAFDAIGSAKSLT